MISAIRTYILLFIISIPVFPQSSFDVNGYLQNMQTVWAPKNEDNWIFSNSIGNRFNFTWYATAEVTFRSSLRNIFDYGQFPSFVPNYSKIAAYDN